MNQQPSFDVRIDTIVIDGLPLDAAGPSALRDAVQLELVRLLGGGTAHSVPGTNVAVGRLSAEPLRQASSHPHELGGQIARSIAGTLRAASTTASRP